MGFAFAGASGFAVVPAGVVAAWVGFAVAGFTVTCFAPAGLAPSTPGVALVSAILGALSVAVVGLLEFGFTAGGVAAGVLPCGTGFVESGAVALVASSAGFSGTEGRRCARMSTARELPASADAGSRDTTSVTTSTSSSFARLVEG